MKQLCQQKCAMHKKWMSHTNVEVGTPTPGLGFTQSPPGVEMHMAKPSSLLILLQSVPTAGFHVTTCVQVNPLASAILPQLSPFFTVRVLHFEFTGMQSLPTVGHFAQNARRLFASSRSTVLMPCDAAIE
jgi:hypothetical protein